MCGCLCDETKMIAYRNACILSRYLRETIPPILQPSRITPISTISLHNDSMSHTRTIHLHKRSALSVPMTRSLTTTGHDASRLTSDGTTLTDVQAYDMIHQLDDAERAALTKAINQYESNKIKSKFQGEKLSYKKMCIPTKSLATR